MTAAAGFFRSTRAWLVAAALALAPGAAAAAEVKPGWDYLSPELRQLQQDEDRHPGLLWVEQGAELWRQAPASGKPACQGCHGDAERAMRRAAPRYPIYDAAEDRLLNLELRIEQCRVQRQEAPAFGYESQELLALVAYVTHQSRGLPMNVRIDGPARPFFEGGRAFFERRQGQLNLSCRQCHDGLAGKRLRGDVISNGVGTAFPAYRLEWNGLGSLHRRFRACAFGVRAVQFGYGAPEYLALELYLAWRARGLPIETPGMRR